MIGQPVFYFDPVREGKIEVKESIIYGAFIHKQEGELHYFLEEKECPAYAVGFTKEEIDEKVKAFIEYRDKLAEANKANKERFRSLRSAFLFPKYSVEERFKEKMQPKEEKE